MRTTTMLFIAIAIFAIVLSGCSPLVDPTPTPDPNAEKIYVSRDPEQCKVIRFMCAENREAFFDELGCGCKLKTENFPVPGEEKVFCAPDQRGDGPCTMEYMPVCGYDNDNSPLDTYGNKCAACRDESVEFYISGECDDALPEKHYCTPEQREGDACTKEYMPVCGYGLTTMLRTYGNACEACHYETMQYWEEGECVV